MASKQSKLELFANLRRGRLVFVLFTAMTLGLSCSDVADVLPCGDESIEVVDIRDEFGKWTVGIRFNGSTSKIDFRHAPHPPIGAYAGTGVDRGTPSALFIFVNDFHPNDRDKIVSCLAEPKMSNRQLLAKTEMLDDLPDWAPPPRRILLRESSL